ncbi:MULTISPECIES: hypothetical protein [unclassified Paenibacillus]|uniref:hypothetical protein n=1 Tax=unclassified Paenibacillus TaxID=185978 RepID=UPI00277FE638|nr:MULTISPECIES: hypothetical protein [unclassified Paenibacillus]MDQ0896293.1 hypothetical protein [Paenibacillus sp. V4I7]MDQ0913779.1 hypothetical protein [Paenibacillus sp. V4I5]
MGENENVEILLLTNAILKDNQLSLKAKGLYFNMIFLNEELDLTMGMIKKMSQIDSDRSIKMGLTELEKGGYIIRKTLQNGESSWGFNSTMNIKNNKEATAVKTLEEKKKNQTNKPIRNKVQPKKNTRTRKTTKKTGLNRALSNFFKEFF